MKNHFIKLFILIFVFTLGLSAEEITEITEDSGVTDEEEKEIYIEEFVEDYEEIKGFFVTYRDPESNQIFLKINKDQLKNEFIYFAHVTNGIASTGKVKGSYADEGVFKIEKDFNNLRFSRVLTTFYYDENNPLSRSKGTNLSNSTFQVSEILAQNEEDTEFLIEITPLLLSEKLTPLLPVYSSDDPHSGFSWGQINSSKSRVKNVFNYETNTDFEVEYVIESSLSSDYNSEDVADPRNVNIQLRYSFIEMPKNNFEPRIANQSIGYFSERITDLTSKDITPYKDLIGKWNLRKKNPDKELSEPVKPITFWIENTTPFELRDYIKQGVLAWNIAFEAAGFKDAIEVKIQPDNAEWDAGDIRYNVLRWTTSPDPMFGGYGPSMTNPRTGEILGADIMLEWVYLTNRINYDAVFNEHSEHKNCDSSSYIQDGMILAEAIEVNDPKIIEQAIIRLTLHEVGHTLGLNHNFKGSYLHDIESVHKPEITSKVGVTASVMEYPAINLAPLGTKQGDYYDTIPGPYDIWAIKYGYTPDLTESELKEIISEQHKPEYMFANDSEDMRYPGRGIDPRAMIYDLTNDPITYAVQRIELVNHSQENIVSKLSKNADSFEEFRLAHRIFIREYSRSLEVISRHIGGVYVERYDPQNVSTKKPYMPAPSDEQRRAMDLLNKYAFSNEAFPINSELLQLVQVERRMFDLYGEHEDPQMHKLILSIQDRVLDHILSPWTLYRISDTQLYGNDYSVNEVINDLTQAIFTGDQNNEVSSVRRNLQTAYVRRLFGILAQDYYDELSVAAVYTSLRDIQKIVRKSSNDTATKSHRKLISWIIESGLDRAQ
ncbi:MAG: hypothetical protein CMB08_07020 [Euryarchaeota archaeon]|nr:hypothetical protein [Euryarchaeota archaeon]